MKLLRVKSLLLALAALSPILGVRAGFDPGNKGNVAIYWGQNSLQKPTGQEFAQQRLSYYCKNTDNNIIPLAFVHVILNPTSVNFANTGDSCNTFPGTTLLDCPEIGEDIKQCQALGKTILLSLGGATYTEGGFPSEVAAIQAANKIWAMFGPPRKAGAYPNSTSDDSASDDSADVDADGVPRHAQRPFGSAVVDGFDFDFESVTNNLVPFATRLRELMDQATTPASSQKRYYLSAAPQCVFPDAAMGAALDAVPFDFVMVQFYNNWCGVQNFKTGGPEVPQNAFNFDKWDEWAAASKARHGVEARVLLGVPGSPTAAGSGYQPGHQLSGIINYCKRFASFAGVMIWDMSQTYSNIGFLDSVVAALKDGGGSGPGPSYPPSLTTTTPVPTYPGTTISTSSSTSSSTDTTTSSTSTEAGTTTTTKTRSGCKPKPPKTSSTATSSALTTLQTSTTTGGGNTYGTVTTSTPPAATGGGLVPQWGQCGGNFYTGPKECQPPFTCVYSSEWWSDCR